MEENVTGYRYIAHLYCLAVQACFYSDVVECSLSTRENLVQSPSGKKEFFFACYIRLKSTPPVRRSLIDCTTCYWATLNCRYMFKNVCGIV